MQNNLPVQSRAAWGSIGIILIGLAMLDGGGAEARGVTSDAGVPDGTRFTAPETAIRDAYQRGKTLLASGDVPGAVAAFRAALADDPQSVDALNGLGIAFDRLGCYDIARGYYDMALAIAPDSPLVLNNIGYSLYLQGDDAAAVPFLKRALAAATPGGPAPAQRILTLIADRMRSRVVAQETVIARAEVTAPQARVELSANGEQRLVMAAAAPAPELVAQLGEAAVLTAPAKAWTPHDEAAIVASAAPSAAPVVTASAPVALVTAAEGNATAAAQTPLLPPRRRVDPVVRLSFVATAQAAAPLPRRPGPRRQRPEAPAAMLALLRDDRALAWLATPAAPSAPPRPSPQPAPAMAPPLATARFDSDDAELNAFAARVAAWRTAGPA